ncbi:FGGY-family carbohydrate kinase [Sphingobacterium composti Ten et al. 2007 non Yoo et al. 2007]|uniref:FGGY-family carbohydrate kinase n=1 Tax=Sphingobacterium composti TaxID=363260 RepID=UPI0013573D0A|nr:FGGY-family carbohydrate kinase [Sphingobacterium composti Ten et al. 2007 non Yoo et al. 2007]
MRTYFFGVDVGTQGARVILVDEKGEIVGAGARKFSLDEGFREEQSPDIWWNDCVDIIDDIIQNLSVEVDKKAIRAISVTSTSGTVIPLDKQNIPLHKAIMYSDPRSAEQGKRIKELAQRINPNAYTGFNASSGISKMLWYIETYPNQVEQIATWVHASDYIVGKLSGHYRVTDYTNVLKSAYDLEKLQWTEFLVTELGLKKDWLQEVVPSGSVVGKLDKTLAKRWGVNELDVVVGITDGCASQMASGAVSPGDWNTTIGTTLVIKGVTKNQVIDPLGRLYSHRHPEGYWMPGGASNTGADWISLDFQGEQLDQLNAQAEALIPTGLLAWPLKQEGERYPIMAANARKIEPKVTDKTMLYTANLEGVAFVEKLAYAIIEDLSNEKVTAVYTAGGGSNSDVWLKIRASVLNVPIYKCKESSGALGAAIMAASQTYFTSVTQAAKAMTSIEKTVYPDKSLREAYDKQYHKFINKLKELSYL